jgi:hypothetical protein
MYRSDPDLVKPGEEILCHVNWRFQRRRPNISHGGEILEVVLYIDDSGACTKERVWDERTPQLRKYITA